MKRSPTIWLLALGAGLLGAAWLALALTTRQGQLVFDPGWLGQLRGDGDALQQQVLTQLRVPRVIAAALVGACLALAGLVLQGVTRNPLADPYLLGVSGGAGLAVVLLQGLPGLIAAAGWWATPLAAFAGAQAAVVLVLTVARGTGGRLTILGLILAGVAINAFCAALMTFALARFDPFRLRVTTLWLAGSVGFASWLQLALVAGGLLAAALYLRAQAHRLDAFALGEAARYVGVDPPRLLVRAALAASLLTGLGVALGGLLGYVGLIIPHAVRLLVGQRFRATLPLAALAGALLLVVADSAARLLFAPEELPVGVLTALLGCPVLILLLRAQLRGPR